MLDIICAMLFSKLEILQRMYGAFALLPLRNFAVLDSRPDFIKYYIKNLKIG